MRLETITFMRNEEFLIPFYFKHYSFVDRMNICLDVSSTDKTEALLKENKKVNLYRVNFPAGYNAMIKVLMINDIFKTVGDSWVLNVDCDEFAFIDRLPADLNSYRVEFYNVFRHVTESNLDLNKSIKENRRYGFLDQNYIKPILVKSEQNIEWGVGNHTIIGKLNKDIPIFCKGAHWENADLSFCIKRRCERKDRYSQYDRLKGFGIHNHNITEEQIVLQCKEHSNDPKIW